MADNVFNLELELFIIERLSGMANSRYKYVKSYELNDSVMPCTWIVVKIKFSGFNRFAELHEFQKPNDGRFSQLMNESTVSLLKEYPDIAFAYGVNDEYSFVFKKATQFHRRRASKVVSVVVSFFVSSFNMLWNSVFPEKELKCGPSFIGRLFFCPSTEILRDYLSWRQVNGFVKNHYNYSSQLLVKCGKSIKEAPDLLLDFSSHGTVELLPQQSCRGYRISQFSDIGSCVYKQKAKVDGVLRRRSQNEVTIDHCDLTSSIFWKEHESIFGKTFHDESPDILVENLDQCLEKVKKLKYAKIYECEDALMPCAWVVIRIDGCHFHRFSHLHQFEKPNDQLALKLMNACATSVLEEFPDVVFSYGVSDEYSFIFKNTTDVHSRCSSKIISHVVSVFSSMYVLKWKEFFPMKKLKYPPSFDGRAVCYPTDVVLCDYIAWRQVDCHINNHYNTCFWVLVKSGKSKSEAQYLLKGTQAQEKNELLRQFGIDYEREPNMFKKGSCVLRRKDGQERSETKGGQDSSFECQNIIVKHCNIIDSSFWEPGMSKDPSSELTNGSSLDLQSFEVKHKPMPSTWIIVKIIFCNFQRFSELYEFEKPNDELALNLMNDCAIALQKEFEDIVFSYGFNDEYSFVFRKETQFEERCSSSIKLSVSLFFSLTYLSKWKDFFPFKDLKEMPVFSVNMYCCPSLPTLQAYLAWRQEECHNYNLHQTCLWMLAKCGKNINEVEALLKDSSIGDKNELLFQQCHINYNTCLPMFRKGSCTFRYRAGGIEKMSECNHCDLNRPSFWNTLSEVFNERKASIYEKWECAERMESFEVKDSLLPSTWVAIMVDVRSLCRCMESNDKSILDLIHTCAVAVLEEFLDILLLYFSRDEFGFVFKKKKLHEKGSSDMKLPIANFFWNAYLKKRLEFFSDQEIGDLPALDWRVFCFPTVAILLDFLACKESSVSRSGDSCFHLLVKSEETKAEAPNLKVKHVAQVEEIGRMNELHEQMTLDYRNGHVCDAWKEFSNILDFRLAYADLLRD